MEAVLIAVALVAAALAVWSGVRQAVLRERLAALEKEPERLPGTFGSLASHPR